MANLIVMLKSLVRTSVDNYVLPGTMTGTEILWLYLIQWKRDMSLVGFVLVDVVCFKFDYHKSEK